jgi:hypothetical protein
MVRSGDRGQGVWLNRFRRAGAPRGFLVMGILALVGLSAPTQAGAMSVAGQYGMAVIVIPVPATLVGGIQLDTPAELTLLKFGIESRLDFTMTSGGLDFHFNSAINIAGLERVITDVSLSLGPLECKMELWSAVPFETVTDVNHFTDWVVVPPGDLMFVKMRLATETSFGSVTVHNLLMLEDVTFPNPGADFGPLEYLRDDQTFGVGDILTISFEPHPGVRVRSITSFSAEPGARPVKGYSAPGRVDADEALCSFVCWDQTITITGLEYCDFPFWLSLAIDPMAEDVVRLGGGGSFSGLGELELSGSFSLFPFLIGGYSFSFSLCDSITATVNLSKSFELTSMTFRAICDIPFGAMTGRLSSSGTFASDLEATSVMIGVSATQGTFSGGLNVGISKQSHSLRLSSVSASLGMTLTPVRVTSSIMFGRTGLRQATLDVGVSF